MIKFCSLVSSSKGNATLVSDGKTNILIDCAMSMRKATEALGRLGIDACDIDAILVTHEHSDHISGVGIMSRHLDIPVYANEATWAAMENSLGKILPENIKCINSYQSFGIKSIEAMAFDIPHDSVSPVGYCLNVGNLKVSVATDMGHIEDSVVESISGSDIVLLEANHDIQMLKNGRYPEMLKKRILGDFGHLSNETSSKIAVELLKSGTRAILLGHLSEENNRPDIAYDVVKTAICDVGGRIDKDIRLAVANRYEISGMF